MMRKFPCSYCLCLERRGVPSWHPGDVSSNTKGRSAKGITYCIEAILECLMMSRNMMSGSSCHRDSELGIQSPIDELREKSRAECRGLHAAPTSEYDVQMQSCSNQTEEE